VTYEFLHQNIGQIKTSYSAIRGCDPTGIG